MPRIDDYISFSSSKKNKVTSEYHFTSELGFLDVEVINRPPEITDVDSLEFEIEYKVSIERQKGGIQDLNFLVDNIELEIKVDDYPNDQKEFEFDIVPDANIPVSSVVVQKGSKLIPCDPTFARIDMRKSMNPKDFRIQILFGSNE
jgi:hypothetical protein